MTKHQPVTPPVTGKAPENSPFRKEIIVFHHRTIHVQGRDVSFRRGKPKHKGPPSQFLPYNFFHPPAATRFEFSLEPLFSWKERHFRGRNKLVQLKKTKAWFVVVVVVVLVLVLVLVLAVFMFISSHSAISGHESSKFNFIFFL